MSTMMMMGVGGSSPPNTDAAQTTAFLARTTGLDGPHTTMYRNLINGLVADGVWSKLDVLYFFATDTTTNALLNLVSTSFGAVVHSSPTFTADQGYTGVDASTTVYIDTTFSPSTAGGNFTQNAAHVSAWCNTAVTSSASGGAVIGLINNAQTVQTRIFPRYSDLTTIFSTNENPISAGLTLGSTSIGHWVANRSTSSTECLSEEFLNHMNHL